MKKKIRAITVGIFVLLLITGCQVNVEKDAEPGFRIYKVDKEKDNTK